VPEYDQQEADFLRRLGHLRQFSSGGRRAPHKPVLLLYALAQLKHHRREAIRYREADEVVTPLLKTYGPIGTRARVADPFARLEGDGIWEIKSVARDDLFDSGGNARPGVLSQRNPEAGFSQKVLGLLQRKPALIDEAARVLLEANLPSESHVHVLQRVGLQLSI